MILSQRVMGVCEVPQTDRRTLMGPDFQLCHDEYEKIQQVLSTLRKKLLADGVLLISRSGQELACSQGEFLPDRAALCSLAAGVLAATFGLARLIEEGEFKRILHRGRKKSFLLSPVGTNGLLLLVLRNGTRDKMAVRCLSRSVMVLEDLLSNRERSLSEMPEFFAAG